MKDEQSIMKLKSLWNMIKPYIPKKLHPAVLKGYRRIVRHVSREYTQRQIKQLTFLITTLITRHYQTSLIPSEELRLHVGATDTAANYWAQSINSSQRVLEIFGEFPTKPLLDWGCGSGRTLQWLLGYPNYCIYYHGCDVDSAAIESLRQKGPFKISVCNEDPPLPYSDNMFGGLFAFSVLTHIHPSKHRDWFAELRRVLEPGGLAYFTTHGAPIINDPILQITNPFQKRILFEGMYLYSERRTLQKCSYCERRIYPSIIGRLIHHREVSGERVSKS